MARAVRDADGHRRPHGPAGGRGEGIRSQSGLLTQRVRLSRRPWDPETGTKSLGQKEHPEKGRGDMGIGEGAEELAPLGIQDGWLWGKDEKGPV